MWRISVWVVVTSIVWCLAAGFSPATAQPRVDDPAAVTALKRMHAGIVVDATGRVASLAPPPERGADAMKFVRGLPGLKSLDLRRSTISDEDLRHLADAPQLQVLNLSHTRIGDAGIEYVAKATRLESLDLSNTRVTDKGMELMAKLGKLKYLHLGHTQVTNAGAMQLRELPELRFVDVLATVVDEETAVRLSRGRPALIVSCVLDDDRVASVLQQRGVKFQTNDEGRIEAVEVTPPQWDAETVAALLRLDHVKTLSLAGCPVTDGQLQRIADKKELRILVLKAAPITDDGLRYLTKLPNLERLDLQSTNITDAGLESIARMGSLKGLSLSATRITNEGFLELAVRAKGDVIREVALNELQIHVETKTAFGKRLQSLVATRTTDAQLAKLVELPNIAWVAFPKSQLTDRGLRELEKWPELREVNVESSDVTDDGMKSLAKLNLLDAVGLDCPRVSDQGLSYFRDHKNLKLLLLRSHRVTDAGLAHLENLKTLEVVHICSSSTTQLGRVKLWRALPEAAIDIAAERWPDYLLKEPLAAVPDVADVPPGSE